LKKAYLRKIFESSKNDIEDNNFEKALEKLNECIKISEEWLLDSGKFQNTNNYYFYYDILSSAYNIIGIIYHKQNKIVKAMTNYINCIITLDSVENLELRSKVYNNIGSAYFSLKDYEKARDYYEKSLDIDESSDYEYGSGMVMMNLTHVLYKMGFVENAFSMVRKMLLILCENEDSNISVGTYALASLIFHESGYFEEAANFHNIASKNFQKMFKITGAKESLLLILEYMIKNELYMEAREFIKNTDKRIIQSREGSLDIKFYHLSVLIYDKLGDKKELVYYLNEYKESSKKVLEEMKSNELTGVEAGKVINSLKNNNENLKIMTETDKLTNLANKGKAKRFLEESINLGIEYGHEVGLIVIDIDNFKHLNDDFGHILGDKCIKALGEILKEYEIIDEVLPARFGGDEFFVIVKKATEFEVLKIAEAIKNALFQKINRDLELKNVDMSISQGVFVGRPYSDDNYMSYVKKADIALYKAKEEKNKIEIYYD